MTFSDNLSKWRRRFLTHPIFKAYRKQMPTMSSTERDAIASGTVTFEADLFRGNPDWHKLLAFKEPTLTAEEKAFLDGPCETLCAMINDWDITHNRADLPEELWHFIKKNGFFGLIIPKEYGGKGFSANAHSQIIMKISGLSITVSTTISVPNSLGPAELLLHYGTKEQKDYYLPRLAEGVEIPCFALTSQDAGSDASAMTDYGIVCHDEINGKKTLGIRLNWSKRYITLAPIATVIGLAFKLYDPDHLLGDKDEIGITCALIPRDIKGITIGKRHYPIGAPFQNGPIVGKDVFIPIDWIIGGKEQAGNGWRMLMECLAAGRAITLPSSAIGGAKVGVYTAGAYARIRKQFNTAIGNFEGIEELLARIGAFTYVMEAASNLTIAAIERGEKPAVASAIVKYHTTELGRDIACDAMDLHGGKAICLGPKNYTGRGYQSIPIAITVEGANVLTRNMIIFGQGAIRCHPYVLQEMEAAQITDDALSFDAFDKAITSHISFIGKNMLRSFWYALTSSFFVSAPSGKTKRYFQSFTRFSTALSLVSDFAMMTLGANLKRKESISARLGDILSYLYLATASLKKFHAEGSLSEDLPLIKYISEHYSHEISEKLNELFNNFPNRFVGFLLKIIIFPLGRHFNPPKDYLSHQISQLLMAPTGTRSRLVTGLYLSTNKKDVFFEIEQALQLTIKAEPIEKLIKEAKQRLIINGFDNKSLWQDALIKKIINEEQFAILEDADEAKHKVIAVDAFATEDLARSVKTNMQLYENAK